MADEQLMKDFVARCLEPFSDEAVGKKPQITCKACSEKRCEEHRSKRCEVCKQSITTAHTHIDFVGHAQLTNRLLQLDPLWSWEPFAVDAETGLPKVHVNEGTASLWIRLTVNGVTRIGVGSEGLKKFGKPNENLLKELIGDALRNAGMRFGLALSLWAKGELAGETDSDPDTEGAPAPTPRAAPPKKAAASPVAKKAATTAKEAATPPPARKAATPPPAPPKPAQAPQATTGEPLDLAKVWRSVPKEYRQELMADLVASPLDTDEGVVAMWPMPTRRTLGESGEPLTDETYAFAVEEAAAVIENWVAAKRAAG